MKGGQIRAIEVLPKTLRPTTLSREIARCPNTPTEFSYEPNIAALNIHIVR